MITQDRKRFNYQTIRLLIPDFINIKDSKNIEKKFNSIINSVNDEEFRNNYEVSNREIKFRIFGTFFRKAENFKKNTDNKKTQTTYVF